MRPTHRTRIRLLLAALLGLATLSAAAAPGLAAAATTLKVNTILSEYVPPGGNFSAFVILRGVGDQPDAGIVTVKVDFPAGVAPRLPEPEIGAPEPSCTVLAQEVDCTIDVNGIGEGLQMEYRIQAPLDPATSGALPPGAIEVSGGGLQAPFRRTISLVAGPIPPFAFKTFHVGVAPTPAGGPGERAGVDPSEVATRFEPILEGSSAFDLTQFAIPAPPEQLRDAVAHLPPGFIGDPTAPEARCTLAELSVGVVQSSGVAVGIPSCPRESQVGIVEVGTGEIKPLYTLVPPPGYPAAFGFNFAGSTTQLLAKLRPSDYGVDVVAERLVNTLLLPATEVDFWGVPSDPSHDHLRSVCLLGGLGYNASMEPCAPAVRNGAPFLRTPTSCPGTNLKWAIEADTWQNVGHWVGKEYGTAATVGCDQLPFDPQMALAPSTRSPGAPSGLDAALTMPQERTPSSLAQADLRSVALTLPQGVAINPPSADGLAACSDSQLRLGLEGPSQCPDAAKIGTLELKSPLLEESIGGSVYLRSQASRDPESGELFRLALEIRSDKLGIDIKLPGSLVADKQTGQLTTHFADLPQLPFESMQLHLKTGPRAPLTTPSACGIYAAHARLEGWNGKVVTISPQFTVDQDCTPQPFKPGFEAGVLDSSASEFAPFTLRVTRDPRQPNLSRIDATLPEGELAKIAGVPQCSDAQAASGSCPAASRIGKVTAGIGEGPSPLFIPQAGKKPTSVYFAGPYRGAPFSIVAEVPAQAGPFDLGTVLVRSALAIDQRTTQVSVTSDPLPQIYGGVPIAYRDVRVEVDRSRFTLNPTDCEPMAVKGQIAAIGGATANVSDRFQVGECASLRFKPRLKLKLRGSTKRSGHPALKAVLTYPQKGAYANIARAQVGLPHAEFLDQGNIGTVCKQAQLRSKTCPKKSIYGRAKAWSPLLDRPLSGPVYLGVGYGHKLPDLVADLDGQIRVLLNGKVDTTRQKGIRNTFEAVPDAPVSRFVLELKGGRKYGLLENSEDLCRKRNRANARFSAQNGAVLDIRPTVQVRCPRSKVSKRSHRSRGDGERSHQR